MAERDYKVVYRSRTVPRDSDSPVEGRRSRVPAALDPYDYPYDGELLRPTRSTRERDSGSVADSTSTLTAPAKSTKESRDTFVDTDRSVRKTSTHVSRKFVEDDDRERRSSRTIVVDQRNSDDRSPRNSGPLRGGTPRGSGSAFDIEIDRPRGRAKDYYIDDSVRREGGAYIIDTRGGEVIDIATPGYEKDGPKRVYEGEMLPPRARYPDDRDRHYKASETLPDGVIVLRRDVTPPAQAYSRYENTNRNRSRRTTLQEGDRDDDWRLVDSMRETRLSSSRSYDQSPKTRSRAPTQSSEDSFVMVSPAQTRTQPTIRSAMHHTDYAPSEIRRRRSRSISFRENEVAHHDCSERRHERPGAEAAICGAYLRRRLDDDFDTQSSYQGSQVSQARARPREESSTTVKYIRDDQYRAPYPPQQDYAPRKRSRSRRRRREREESDDESYYSEHKKYVKETRYL